jgi:hypothetical protein
VSAVRTVSAKLKVLQISAPISQGSSGGPVVNDRGLVIGVSTLIASAGQNLNFAMPVNQLKPLLLATVGTPIASFKVPGARQRNIPHHDPSLLKGCASSDQVAIVKRIDAAIESGAPVYNKGSYEGCFHIYAAAAYEIDTEFPACKGPRRALADGIKRAESLSSFDDKAWAMRDAFDGLIEVIRATAAAPPPVAVSSLPTPPPRAVPQHGRSASRLELDRWRYRRRCAALQRSQLRGVLPHLRRRGARAHATARRLRRAQGGARRRAEEREEERDLRRQSVEDARRVRRHHRSAHARGRHAVGCSAFWRNLSLVWRASGGRPS